MSSATSNTIKILTMYASQMTPEMGLSRAKTDELRAFLEERLPLSEEFDLAITASYSHQAVQTDVPPRFAAAVAAVPGLDRLVSAAAEEFCALSERLRQNCITPFKKNKYKYKRTPTATTTPEPQRT